MEPISIKKFYDQDMLLMGIIVVDLLIAGKTTDASYMEEKYVESAHGMEVRVLVAQIEKQIKYLNNINNTLRLFLP